MRSAKDESFLRYTAYDDCPAGLCGDASEAMELVKEWLKLAIDGNAYSAKMSCY